LTLEIGSAKFQFQVSTPAAFPSNQLSGGTRIITTDPGSRNSKWLSFARNLL